MEVGYIRVSKVDHNESRGRYIPSRISFFAALEIILIMVA